VNKIMTASEAADVQETERTHDIIPCIGCAYSLRVPLALGLLEVSCPGCKASWYWAPSESDATSDGTLIPGSHVVSPRLGYTHHGIYVGGDHVIHYSGLADGLGTGPVELATLADFCGSKSFYVKDHKVPRYSGAQAIERAKSRIGEELYHLGSNNCEHFCEWAIEGDHDSAQVTIGTGVAAPASGTAVGIAALEIVAGAGAVGGLSGSGVLSGLASVGSIVGGGAVAGIAFLGAAPGVGMAYLVNSSILKDSDAHDDDERSSRSVGRVASYAGVAAGTAGSIASVSAFGTVAGLSGSGIASGLAAIGSTVGGGMAAGVAITTAAPAIAAVAAGYGIYKLIKWAKS
jgi:hypothetical protein